SSPAHVPVARPKPRSSRGMDGFDGVPLVAGTASGYRVCTMRDQQLHLDPGDAGKDWEPGLLRGQKDFWQPGVNQARCLAPGLAHDPGEVPHDDCACVVPETRVLTSDLRWVPAGDLEVGEHLFAFDEYQARRGWG